MNKLITIGIYITIFISSYVLFKSPFEGYISYFVMLFLFPLMLVRYGIPKLPLLIFLPLLVSGFIYIMAGDNNFGSFIKIFIGFFAAVLFYRYVLEMYDYDVPKLFGWYVKGCVIVSVIGIFQVISFRIGFKPGYDFHWIFNKWGLTQGGLGVRMNSVFSEPAYFAAVVGPAFFVAIHNLFWRTRFWMTKRQAIIIVIAYLLTFSSLGILGIFLAILLLLLNYGFVRYAIIFVPLAYFGFGFVYNNVEEFRERYDGTLEVFVNQNIRDYDVHGSSFVLYNNFTVAFENFKRNPILGTGLGSQETAFDRYSLTRFTDVIQIDFNKSDANSMFLRLMSETGLYGILFIIIFLFKHHIPRTKSANDYNWIISNGILMVILLYLARQGHYFINGFPFFLWCYYYVSKSNKAALAEELGELTTVPINPSVSKKKKAVKHFPG